MTHLKNNAIQVITAAEQDYVQPMTIMLFSVLENLENATPINISVISNDLKAPARDVLCRLVSAYKNATIVFYCVEDTFFKHLGTHTDYISSATYYRLMIPDLVPGHIEKAIYLDADMIVRNDIAALWQVDLKEKAVGAVPEKTPEIRTEPWDTHNLRRLQLPLDHPCFNAGLLLMNLNAWRSQDVSRTCIEFLKEYPERTGLDDQDALNYVLQDNWLALDYKWNIITVWYHDEIKKRLSRNQIYNACKHPAIIHYTSREKPWLLYSSHARKQDFLDYWNRFAASGIFCLGPERRQIQQGTSIICICTCAQYLEKALASWLNSAHVDEVVLIDPAVDSQVDNIINRFSDDRIVLVKLSNLGNPDLTDGVLFNLALRMTSKDKILKLSADTLLYDDFFDRHQLKENIFFNIYFWQDWVSGKKYMNSVLYAFRNDLLGVNGFHEHLTGNQTVFNMFHRLYWLGKNGIWMDNGMLLLMSRNHLELSEYRPLGAVDLPPLTADQMVKLISIKNDQITRIASWDFKNVFTPFELVKTDIPNKWIAALGSLGVTWQESEFPHGKVQKATLIRWIVTLFPNLKAYETWFDRYSTEQLNKWLFGPENIGIVLTALLHTRQFELKNICQKISDPSRWKAALRSWLLRLRGAGSYLFSAALNRGRRFKVWSAAKKAVTKKEWTTRRLRAQLKKDFRLYKTTWTDTEACNAGLYSDFERKTRQIDFLDQHVEIVEQYKLGFGERAFRYLWAMLFAQTPDPSKFLEIGVYKGSIPALSQVMARHLNKTIRCCGVTPLNNTADKYSEYPDDDYQSCIRFLYNRLGIDFNNTTIIQGLSTDVPVQEKIRQNGPYHIIYIDGGHDLETVTSDIKLCITVLADHGFIVVDDSSVFLKFGKDHPGFAGHEAVSTAVSQTLEKDSRFRHLFACGHNRVWQKI